LPVYGCRGIAILVAVLQAALCALVALGAARVVALVLLLHAYAPAYAIEPLGRAIQAGLPLGAIRLVLHAGAGRVAVIKAN